MVVLARACAPAQQQFRHRSMPSLRGFVQRRLSGCFRSKSTVTLGRSTAANVNNARSTLNTHEYGRTTPKSFRSPRLWTSLRQAVTCALNSGVHVTCVTTVHVSALGQQHLQRTAKSDASNLIPATNCAEIVALEFDFGMLLSLISGCS
eukprot:1531763-Rhodomonas_salina.1